ncbi:MAG: hypothetical protein ACE5EL_02880 [Anaerolineae bacterium]
MKIFNGYAHRAAAVAAGASLAVAAMTVTATAGEAPGAGAAGPGVHGGPIVIPIPIYGCGGPGLPLPTPPPPPPGAGGAAAVNYRVCPQVTGRVPNPVVQYALANPHAIAGYGLRRNPNVPAFPWNQYRSWLTLRDFGKPWNECNSVVWKAGCP